LQFLIVNNIVGGLVNFFWRARRARARGTPAHVRNVPSSVLPKSTVQQQCAHLFTRLINNCAQLIKCAENNNEGETQQQQQQPNNEELGPGICPKFQMQQDSGEGWWIVLSNQLYGL
jgi:hypothetical protein